MKICVNHVAKTAGTSIFAAFETAFPENRVISTLSYWDKLSISSPIRTGEFGYDKFVSLSAVNDIKNFDYVHGHFKQLFFDLHCADYVKIGTSRDPLTKILSAAKHILRDPNFGGTGAIKKYINKEPVDLDEVAKSLLAQSHLSFYGLAELDNVRPELNEMVRSMLESATKAVSKYDAIIDSSVYDQKIAQFQRAISNISTPPRLNTAKQFEHSAQSFDEIDFINRLKNDFKLFLDAEYILYERLLKKSQEEICPDFLIGRSKTSSSSGYIDFSESISTEGFDIRTRSSLYGRENEFTKKLLINNPKIHFPQKLVGSGGTVEVFVFFWTSRPCEEDELTSITLNTSAHPIEVSNKVLFIDMPSKHLYLLRSNFRFNDDYRIDGLTINVVNSGDSEIFCCGGKYYAHK
jgi:hypothetical protein